MKKIMILGFVFLLLSSFIFAEYYSFDKTDYYYNGTYYYVDGITATDTALNTVAVVNGNLVSLGGWHFVDAGVTRTHTYSNDQAYKGSLSIKCGQDNIWVNLTNTTFNGSIGLSSYYNNDGDGSYSMFSNIDTTSCSGTGNYIGISNGISTTHFAYSNCAGVGAVCNLNAITKSFDTWTNITWKFNNNNGVYADGYLTSYINNVSCHSESAVGTPESFYVAREGVDENDYIYVDDIWVANGERPMNSSINFNPPTPSNNAVNDTYIGIQINASCESGTLNLYWDGNLISSYISGDGNFTLNNSLVTTERTYNYSGSCGILENVTRYWTYDATDPTITINSNNFYKSDNTTRISKLNLSAYLDITLQDNNDLFAYEVNMTDSTGDTVYYELNNTLSGIEERINKIISFNNFSLGNVTVKFTLSDSHTDEVILPYIVKEKQSELEFNTKEKNNIKITSKDIAITKATKLIDRYSFDFDFTDGLTKERQFDIYCDGTLYKRYTNYTAHFVCSKDRLTGNWIDLEGTGKHPVIKKVTDKHYTVTFDSLGGGVTFNSIGGLNTDTIYNTFDLYSNYPSDTYIDFLGDRIWNHSGIYNGLDSISLNITKINNKLSDRCNCSGCSIVGSNCRMPMIFHSSNIGILNINLTNATYSYGIDNCSNSFGIPSNYTALDFSIFHEDTLAALTINSSDGYFEYLNLNFTVNVDNVNNFKVCVYPSYGNITIDAFIKYDHSQGFNERYYLDNTVLSGTTKQVYMYNFDYTTGISELNTIIKDQIYAPKQNVIVKLQRWYSSDGVWRTIQVDKTDEFGKAVFYVIQKEEDYKFIFEEEGVEIDRSESVKFVCETATECEQTFVLYDVDDDDKFVGMDGSITYDETAGLYMLTWSDPDSTSSAVRFLVEKQASNGIVTICDTEVVSSSGTIVCNVSSYEGVITARAFRSASPFSNWLADIQHIQLDALFDTVGNAEGMTLSTIFMIGIIGFGASTGSGVAVVFGGIFGLIVLFIMELNSIMSISFVIGGLAIGLIVAFMVKK